MTSYNSTISRLQTDIADLHKRDAAEAKKEADLTGKVARALDEVNRTKNPSSQISKMRDIERFQKESADIRHKRADYSSKIAAKTKELHSNMERQATEDERGRRKVADEQKKLIRDREDHERRITSEIRNRSFIRPPAVEEAILNKVSFDYFISHASEDKEEFVRSLAEELRALGANVFYDEFTLKVGDSLRRNIDRGLASSKFGVVVLSEHFFKKEWPARELDGLVAQEIAGRARILPIWHKVSKDEVAAYSPPLADKIALNTAVMGVKEIAKELYSLLS